MHAALRTAVVLALVAVGLMLAAPSAQADTFNFTSDHCSGGCGTAPFGTVTLTQQGTSVLVDVHLNSPNFFVVTGSAKDVFDFNATGVLATDITITQNAPNTLSVLTGPIAADGTGTFSFAIACASCPNGAGGRFNTDIIFTVANATTSDLEIQNAAGNFFAADIISCNVTACGSGTGTGNTGYIDVSTGTVTAPEPATVAFLGTGLVALGFAVRRRARR